MEIENVIAHVARREKLNPIHLNHIGTTQEDIIGVKMWWFNVMDPNHIKYKSTIVHTENYGKEKK